MRVKGEGSRVGVRELVRNGVLLSLLISASMLLFIELRSVRKQMQMKITSIPSVNFTIVLDQFKANEVDFFIRYCKI